jgi:hypothetical protein
LRRPLGHFARRHSARVDLGSVPGGTDEVGWGRSFATM